MAIVSNLINDNGRSAANQFVIIGKEGTFFQSYKTTIAWIDQHGVTIDRDALNYSRTTSKHLYIFLRDYTQYAVRNKQDVEKCIKEGYILVADLNEKSKEDY